ncbi:MULTISPECIES: GTP pyrophosphokinase [unclassified Butyrivibrio]|uniref:GTP pyrophosphokinase n=1 Tax=unclassified Butyrivibrio TaxID=2639466 RepID=UPI0003FD8B4E|nr:MULTISPECIES: GTP pyrophosphokinase family protein [unclassified Butyrivibrio]
MAIGNLDLTSLDRTLMTNEQKSLLNVSNVSQKEIEQLLIMRGQVQEFQIMMMKYDCALSEVRTKLEVLNKELSLKNNRNPFESIKSRIKTPVSIYEKLNRKGVPFSIENIESNISDIAGCRAICSFVDDIYMVADCLKKQDDVNVLVEKDYIATPKDSGYRSLHLIIETPIFLTDVKEMMKVEVQFRTIAMDFWASLEHKMKYKKDIENADLISEDLKFSADLINQLDRRMQQIREKIDAGDGRTYRMTPTEEEERADSETMEIIRREIQAEQKAMAARRKK